MRECDWFRRCGQLQNGDLIPGYQGPHVTWQVKKHNGELLMPIRRITNGGKASTPSAAPSRRCPCTTLGTEQAEIVLRRYRSWQAAASIPAAFLDAAAISREDADLQRFVRKLQLGPVRVGALGGSITAGHGVVRGSNFTWPHKAAQWLAFIWGQRVEVNNGAKPATGAAFGALCFDTLLPEGADLVVVEYSHNTFETEKMEVLVKTVRARGAALVVLDYSRCCNVPPREPFDAPRGVRFLSMLRRHGVPVLAFEALRGWWMHEADASGESLASYFSRRVRAHDHRHVTEHGHAMMAETVVRLLHVTWLAMRRRGGAREDASKGASEGRAPPPAESSACCASLVEPSAHTDCVIGERLLQYNLAQEDTGYLSPDTRYNLAQEVPGVRAAQEDTDARGGWRYVHEKRDKPGFVSRVPGATLSLSIPSHGPPHLGPRFVHVLYLQSFEHMGVALFSCAGACACDEIVVDAHNAQRVAGNAPVSLETVAPAIEIRYEGRPRSRAVCQLRVRVLPNTTSGEHKFKVTALIVTSRPEDSLGLDDVAHFVDMSSRSDYTAAAING